MGEKLEGLPVAGYKPQSAPAVGLVNVNKEIEERLLRRLDELLKQTGTDNAPIDGRWLALCRTHFEQGFMALNRAIFQPSRIKLPEDIAP